MKIHLAALALGLLAVSGCASITSGSSQEVVVNTTPDQAHCKLMRQGIAIGDIPSTPGSVTIKKAKYDLTIECDKDGFYKSVYYNHSGVQEMTFGNIILGGVGGWAIDSATGSDNHYTSPVDVSMVPLSAGTPPEPVYSEPPKKTEQPKVEAKAEEQPKKTNEGVSGAPAE